MKLLDGLEFSHAKTKVLFITRRKGRKAEPPAPLMIYGKELEYSETAKYIGVTIDNKLSWRQHIQNKMKSAKATETQYNRDWLRSLQRLGLLMIGLVRRGCPSGAFELIYDVKPLHNHSRDFHDDLLSEHLYIYM